MAKQYIAIAVDGNHDWDFDIDNAGQIIGLNIKGEVDWSDGENERRTTERLDIWLLMTAAQKIAVQNAYDKAVLAFKNNFIG